MRHSTGTQDPHPLYFIILLCLLEALSGRLPAGIDPRPPRQHGVPALPPHERATSAIV